MRKGRIWAVDKEELRAIVSKANSFAEILRKIDYVVAGVSYRGLKSRLVADEIDFSHIPLGLDSNRNRKILREQIPLADILVEHSTYNRFHLKKRLIREGVLQNKCYICGLLPIWNNKPIVMVLDHINGIRDDNRLGNLRLVCPNCNSQLDTFCGKNTKTKPANHCLKCNKTITRKSSHCSRCAGLLLYEKEISRRPSKEQLISEVTENGWATTGKKYDVTGNTVKKWLKAYGFEFDQRVRPKNKKKSFITVCRSKSGFIGVKFNKNRNKWEASIWYKKKYFYLGLYKTPEEAHLAYIKKRNDLYNVKEEIPTNLVSSSGYAPESGA